MVEEDIPTGQSSFNHIGQCNDSNIKVEDVDGSDDGLVDYKSKYRNLKRKLKCLLYEQECFHEELRKLQRKCLRVNRDKSFLLDRLLQYEQPDISSDDEVTSSSEEDGESAKNLNLAKNRNKSSVTSKTQSSPKSVEKQSKATLNTIAGDKVRCRRIENGKQCPKLVSIKVKSGICYAHRQQLTGQKQGPSSKSGNTIKTSSPKSKSDKHPKQFTGGKDIGQIREAMEANALLESSSPGMYGEEEDDLVIDLPHQ